MATKVCINNDGIVTIFCLLLHTHPFHSLHVFGITYVVLCNLGLPYMMYPSPLISFPQKKWSKNPKFDFGHIFNLHMLLDLDLFHILPLAYSCPPIHIVVLFHTLPHHSFCGLHKTFPEVFCFHNLHTHIALVSSTLFDNNSTTLMQRFISPIDFSYKFQLKMC